MCSIACDTSIDARLCSPIAFVMSDTRLAVVCIPLTICSSAETVAFAQAARTPQDWQDFARRYRREMAAPDAAHAIGLLAALSQQTDFALGCYCEDESRCHRSLLRELLRERGARLAP